MSKKALYAIILLFVCLLLLFGSYRLYRWNREREYNRILNDVKIGTDLNNNGIWDEVEPIIENDPLVQKDKIVKNLVIKYIKLDRQRFEVWDKTKDINELKKAELDFLNEAECLMDYVLKKYGEKGFIEKKNLDRKIESTMYNTADTLLKSYMIDDLSGVTSRALMNNEQIKQRCKYEE